MYSVQASGRDEALPTQCWGSLVLEFCDLSQFVAASGTLAASVSITAALPRTHTSVTFHNPTLQHWTCFCCSAPELPVQHPILSSHWLRALAQGVCSRQRMLVARSLLSSTETPSPSFTGRQPPMLLGISGLGVFGAMLPQVEADGDLRSPGCPC